MLRRIAGWSGAVVVASALTVGAAQVSINMARTFQTMEGMGAMHDIKPWKVRQGPFYVDVDLTNTYDSLVNVMGMTIHRIFIEGGEFEPSPGEYVIYDNMEHFFGTTVRRMKEFADASNEPYLITPAILTPPHFMKYNNKNTSGSTARDTTNRLIPEYYDDFGVFCAKFLQTVKDSFGITCYAFSPQNEPAFNEPYSSCSYRDGAHYADMLAEVGPRIRATGLGTVIYGCEHMGWAHPRWERQVLDNSAAAPYLDRFAVHGYTDGVRLDTTILRSILHNGLPVRPLWMSEISGTNETHDEAMAAARLLMGHLTRSNVSAWIQLGWEDFINRQTGERWPMFWTYAQFYRFIRPGMQRVEATSDDSQIRVAAFKDDDSGAFSAVMMNTGTSARSVTLSFSGGAAPDTLEMRRTTPTEKFVYDGSVEPTASITIPANSIVSLGIGHRGASNVGVVHAPQRATARAGGIGVVRLYDLRGRSLGTVTQSGIGVEAHTSVMRRAATGVYCVEGLNAGAQTKAVIVSPVR